MGYLPAGVLVLSMYVMVVMTTLGYSLSTYGEKERDTHTHNAISCKQPNIDSDRLGLKHLQSTLLLCFSVSWLREP